MKIRQGKEAADNEMIEVEFNAKSEMCTVVSSSVDGVQGNQSIHCVVIVGMNSTTTTTGSAVKSSRRRLSTNNSDCRQGRNASSSGRTTTRGRAKNHKGRSRSFTRQGYSRGRLAIQK